MAITRLGILLIIAGAARAANPLLDSNGNVPESLSTSALFSNFQTRTFANFLFPYAVNAPLWSDGEEKSRFMALPSPGKILFADGSCWTFPNQTVFVKNFYIDTVAGNPATRKIIETRLLLQRDTSDFEGYSYIWTDDLSEARLLQAESTKTFTIRTSSNDTATIFHAYPNRNQCLQCHTPGANFVLGVRTSQMNRTFSYGNAVENQLSRLDSLGVFTSSIGNNPSQYTRQPDPLSSSDPLESRARSYLDANCAQCHHPGGDAGIDLRFFPLLDAMQLINVTPNNNMGIDGAMRIKPGFPDSSILFIRLTTSGYFRMPPLATHVFDSAGDAVIRDWIISLGGTGLERKSGGQLVSGRFRISPNPLTAGSQPLVYWTGGAFPAEGPVWMGVYDPRGRLIRELTYRPSAAAPVDLFGNGQTVAQGFYVLRLKEKNVHSSIKISVRK